MTVMMLTATLAAATLGPGVDFKPLGGIGELKTPKTLEKHAVFEKAPPARKDGLSLIDGDRVVTVVVNPHEGKQDLLMFGRELAWHLEKMSGRKIKVVEPAKRPESGPVIVIGLDEEYNDRGTMIIRRKGDELYLGGGAEGPSHAVTYVLEALGCRYLWAGKTGKVIPKKAKVVLPEIEIVRDADVQLMRRVSLANPSSSSYRERFLPQFGIDATMLSKRLFKDEDGVRETRFNRDFWEWHGVSDTGRIRYSGYVHGGSVHGGHSFGDYYKRFHKEHPDWFAMQGDGTRVNRSPRPQLCLSNPGLIEEVIQERVRMFREHPEMKALSVSMPDGSYDRYCMCEECRKLDPENQEKRPMSLYVGEFKNTVEGEYVFMTDRILTFANRVMAGVRKECPGKRLALFSYSVYDRPPVKVRPDPDLIFLNVAGDYRWAKQSDWAAENLAGWLSFGNPIIWRPNCMNYMRAIVPCDVSERIFNDIENAKANGCVGISLDCVGRGHATRALTYYLCAKAFLNPDRLAAAWYRRDFLETAFGKAARTMDRYFAEQSALFWKNAKLVPNARNVESYVALFDVDKFQAILDQAKREAADDPDVLARLGFIQLGMDGAKRVKALYVPWSAQNRKALDAEREVFRKYVKDMAEHGNVNAFDFCGIAFKACPFMRGGVRNGPPVETLLTGEADDNGNVIER